MKNLIIIISIIYIYLVGLGAELIAGGPAAVNRYGVPSRVYQLEMGDYRDALED